MADPTLPKISIVTPSLNQGRFLEQCLASIFAQGYSNLECLVVDGASTDQSRRIIEQFSPRVTWWVSEPDGGQSDAINKGFRRATGEVVAWLNADDFYLPGALGAVAAAWKEDPDAPFWFGDGVRADEQGRTIAGYFPGGTVIFNRSALVYGLNYILQPATFINQRCLGQVGYLDPELRWGMDSDLWLKLSALGEPRAIGTPLAATREYAQTKTSTGAFARIEELRRIAERHADVAMTPGVICYLLDTLHRLARQRPDIYPAAYVGSIEAMWSATSGLFDRWGARPEGFAYRADSPPGGQSNPIGRTLRRLGMM